MSAKSCSRMVEEMGTIQVVGTGTATAAVDTIVLRFMQEVAAKEYAAAVEQAAKQFEHCKDLAGGELKTSSYTVDTDYQYHEGKRTMQGFIVRHSFSLKFDFSMVELAKRISDVSKSKVPFSIELSASDSEGMKKACIENAVADAADKAKLIAKSASLKIKGIVSITYGSVGHAPRTTMMLAAPMLESRASVNIQPEEATSSETVNIIFEVE